MKKLILSLLIIPPFRILAEHNHDEHLDQRVDHLTFYDTFFGEENMNQVCYPKDHQSFFYVIFGLMIVTIILATVIFYFRSKYTKRLKEKNELISNRNHEIMDSLKYAVGIQRTILPTKDEIEVLFPNSFVYYKPKDIVSGDFYYCAVVDGFKYIAVIDCTGHGVPGAFLTLIGNQALNRAIHDDGIRHCNEILSQMNRYVKRTLKQMREDSIQDGMVISLVRFDHKNDEMEFAGAGMDLLLINKEKVERIRGNRLTVGTDEKHITQGPDNKIFKLSDYSKIVLYSDGIIDQFGRNNEKFKTRHLLTFIEERLTIPAEKFGAEFSSYFQDWMKNQEQTDDITLIGIDV